MRLRALLSLLSSSAYCVRDGETRGGEMKERASEVRRRRFCGRGAESLSRGRPGRRQRAWADRAGQAQNHAVVLPRSLLSIKHKPTRVLDLPPSSSTKRSLSSPPLRGAPSDSLRVALLPSPRPALFSQPALCEARVSMEGNHGSYSCRRCRCLLPIGAGIRGDRSRCVRRKRKSRQREEKLAESTQSTPRARKRRP